jgi:hypothetical protein
VPGGPMSILGRWFPDTPGRPDGPPRPEEYSPAFAALALLLTLGVLAGFLGAVWVLAGP